MDKDDYVNAICGCSFGGYSGAISAEKAGLARFAGNQWNESWEWSRAALKNLTLEQLASVYSKYKNN